METGYIAALIFCSIIFAAFCLAPNIYLLVKHFKSNEKSAVTVTPQVDWALLATSKEMQ